MSKISNQSAYPATTPVSGDFLIGTDVSDSNATKTFTVGSIVALTPDNTLAEVLTAGNTATNNINLTGNVILTGTGSIVMSGGITAATGNISAVGYQASSFFQGALLNVTNIQDGLGDTGLAGQYLSATGTGLQWQTVGANTLSEVLTAGNTATNDINLTGNITCTNLTATQDVNGDVFNATTQVSTPLMDATDIQDNANLNGTAGQYLRKSSPGNVLAWETVAAPTLSTVLAAGNTATNDITLTGNIALTGNLTGTGDITRTGAVTITGGITSTATVEGSALKGNSGVPLKVPGIDTYADDAAAAALATGDVYMTSGTAAAPLNVAGILMVKQ